MHDEPDNRLTIIALTILFLAVLGFAFLPERVTCDTIGALPWLGC